MIGRGVRPSTATNHVRVVEMDGDVVRLLLGFGGGKSRRYRRSSFDALRYLARR